MRIGRIALATVVATGIAIAVPAPASATVSGSVSFHCTARLPGWPSPAGSGHCANGTTPAAGYVTLSGLDGGGGPYVVQGPGAFHAEFTYSAACVASEPPLVGTAEGVATVEDVPAVHRRLLTTADVHVQFTWTRLGANAMIAATGWLIEFGHGGTASGSLGAGHATFVPVLQPSHFCPIGGPLEALVQGEVTALL